MLAMLAPEQVDDIVAPHRADRDLNSLRTTIGLHEKIARIRTSGGIAYEANQRISGIRNNTIDSLGCAVGTSDGTLTSLCVAGPSATFNLRLVTPAIKVAAAQLGQHLSGPSEKNSS